MSFLRGEGGKAFKNTHYTCGNHRYLISARRAIHPLRIASHWNQFSPESGNVAQDCEDDSP